MHTTLELTLKRFCFVSSYFPLSSTSKTNIQPIILLLTHQPLTQGAAHAHCICALQQEHIILHQGAYNTIPASA